MQFSAFLSFALSIPLTHSQSTTAYVGLLPSNPTYDTNPSSVFTAIEPPPPHDPCGPAPHHRHHTPSPPRRPPPHQPHPHHPLPPSPRHPTPPRHPQKTNPTRPFQRGAWVSASADGPDQCYLACFYLPPPYDGSAQRPSGEGGVHGGCCFSAGGGVL